MEKYRNRIIAGVLLALVIYIGLLLVFDNSGQLTTGVLDALQTFPAWLVLLLILTQMVVAFSRFLVWQYYMKLVGAHDKMSRADSAIISISGYVLVMSPGKAAELLKAVLVKLKTGVPIARTAPVVIAERVVDGFAVLLILVASLLLLNNQLALGDYANISRTIVFSSAAVLVGGLIVVQIAPLANFLLNLLKSIPLVRRLHAPLVDFYASSREIFYLPNLLPAVLRGIGVYLASSVGFILILWGFGLTVDTTLILQAVFINGVTAAIGALSFIPNGAGITEISTLAMLRAIVMPGNPAFTVGAAAAAALLQGFFHKWFRVLFGLVVAVIFRKRLLTPGFAAELQAMGTTEHPASRAAVPLPTAYELETPQP